LLGDRTKNFFHKPIDTFCFIALAKSVTQNMRGVTDRQTLPNERNPFPAKNQTPSSYTVYVSPAKYKHHQLLFKENLLQKGC